MDPASGLMRHITQTYSVLGYSGQCEAGTGPSNDGNRGQQVRSVRSPLATDDKSIISK